MRISDWSSDVCSSDLVDSKPEEVDELDRRIIQLKIEREALKKETDAASKDRLDRLEKELADLEEQSATLTAAWQAEKDKLGDAQKLKEQLDAARLDLEQAQRKSDWNGASELSYGVYQKHEQKQTGSAADRERVGTDV